jgi:hypothetical protein
LGVGLTTPSREKVVTKTSKMVRKGSINRWRRRAINGDEWRHALREAKARKGL